MSSGGSTIASSTTIVIVLDSVRTPPSLTSLTGIVVTTASSNSYLIDQSSGTISYTATSPGSISSSLVVLSADTSTKINTQTSLTVRIQNTNPIPSQSYLKIVVPSEFGTSLITSVTGSGSRMNSNPTYTLSTDKRTISITAFNNDYLESGAYIYIIISTLVNPSSTSETSSFSITILDSSNSQIETISSNVVYQATPGLIDSVIVTSDKYYINYNLSHYTFSFIPQDSFNTSAIIYIVFPDQVNITDRTKQSITSASSSDSSLSLNSKAQLTVTQNKYATIKNLFLSAYSSSLLATVTFTIDKITNADTVDTTDTFAIYIKYSTSTSSILSTTTSSIIDYLDSGINLTFVGSPLMDYSIDLDSWYTGADGTMMVNIDTGGYSILKGSIINLTIPGDFLIFNSSNSEDSCVGISGFSDDITCSFTQISSTLGHVLIITGGFDSDDYSGSEIVSFNISEIRNPHTTLETGSFALYVYDSSYNVEYYANSSYTVTMEAAPFSYAMVTSSSPYSGQSSTYTFTLTLSVDTPLGTYILVTLPSEISYDSSQSQYQCSAGLNLNASISCILKNATTFQIQVWGNSLTQSNITNGTTIGFIIGNLINPISMEESSSFFIQTYNMGTTSLTKSIKYFINQEDSSLTIKNTKSLTLSNLQIIQIGSAELNAATSLQLSFTTPVSIPASSYLILTLPNNIKVTSNKLSISLNNNLVSSSISYVSSSRQLTFQIPSSIQQNVQARVVISGGIFNPDTAPYSYSSFLISIQSQSGYGIVTAQSSDEWVSTQCTSNCATCIGKLSNCTTCSISDNQDYYLQGQSCLSQCPKGFFGETGVCKSCEYPCLECSYGAQLCTKCSPDYVKPFAYPLQLTCFSTCPNGTYLDTDQALCMECQSPCYTCSSKSQCQSCDNINKTNLQVNFNALDSQCYENCPSGTFQTLQKQCIPCTSPCNTCSELPGLCTSCKSGYFLYGEQCVDTCPKQYTGDPLTQLCNFNGEMAFPVPFTILTLLVTFLLLIANFMRNKTRLFISLMTLTDVILKLNWIVLFILLGSIQAWVSFGIIGYCLVANLIINFFIWRLLFHKYQIESDSELQKYAIKFKRTYKVLLFLSFTVSFHLFRLTYSGILGMKQFSANFKNSQRYYSLMGRLTIISAFLLYAPAVAANILNLIYVNQLSQAFYLDIDSLLIVVYLCILIFVVVHQRERVEKSLLDIGELITVLGENSESQEDSHDQKKQDKATMGGIMNQINRHSIINKHFSDSPTKIQNEEGMKDYSQSFVKQILGKVLGQYQSSAYNSADPKKKDQYFSKNSEYLDYNEFWKLKEQLRQSELQLHLLRKQLEIEASNYEGMQQELNLVNTEYEGLISQEEKLRREIEELKSYLYDYEDSTLRELEDTQSLRKDEIKNKVKMSKLKKVITDVVLKQSQSIIGKSKKGKKKRKGKTGPSFLQPTKSSENRKQALVYEQSELQKEIGKPFISTKTFLENDIGDINGSKSQRNRETDSINNMPVQINKLVKTSPTNMNQFESPEERNDNYQEPPLNQQTLGANEANNVDTSSTNRLNRQLNFHEIEEEKNKLYKQIDLESSQIKDIEDSSQKQQKRGRSQNPNSNGQSNNQNELSATKPPLYQYMRDRSTVSQQGPNLLRQKNKSMGQRNNNQQLVGLQTQIIDQPDENVFGNLQSQIQRPFTREDNKNGDTNNQWM